MSRAGWRWTFDGAPGEKPEKPARVQVAALPALSLTGQAIFAAADVPPELRERVERYVREGMPADVAPRIAARVAANELRAGHGPEVDECAACLTEMRSV